MYMFRRSESLYRCTVHNQSQRPGLSQCLKREVQQVFLRMLPARVLVNSMAVIERYIDEVVD